MCNKEFTYKSPSSINVRRWLESLTYQLLLRFYVQGTKAVRLPILGRYIRGWLSRYAATEHGGIVLSREEAKEWIRRAEDVVLSFCYCRKTFKRCNNSLYLCLRLSSAKTFLRMDEGAEKICKEEAERVIDEAERGGLFHLFVWCPYPYIYAICNCCTCCCTPYTLLTHYAVDAIKKGRMIARKDKGLCRECGECERVCAFQKECFGCGLCEKVCKNGAIKLLER